MELVRVVAWNYME